MFDQPFGYFLSRPADSAPLSLRPTVGWGMMGASQLDKPLQGEIMERMLVAFEAPDVMGTEAYEAKWDGWVSDLHRRGLQLVNDMDPVATTGSIEVYEVTAL